jgi:hypothetical protein
VGGYGPDVQFIDRALEWTFERSGAGYPEAGDNGFLRRSLLRPLARPAQREPLHTCGRLLAGIHGAGEPQGQATRLRLPRDA